jgi:hypothetical protein
LYRNSALGQQKLGSFCALAIVEGRFLIEKCGKWVRFVFFHFCIPPLLCPDVVGQIFRMDFSPSKTFLFQTPKGSPGVLPISFRMGRMESKTRENNEEKKLPASR